MVFVFQDGNLSGLLDFTPLGFVDATLPILMFCTIFGVSMDYEVFLLSRIREAYENGDSNTASVSKGLVATAGIITSAAAIIIVVTGAFAFNGHRPDQSHRSRPRRCRVRRRDDHPYPPRPRHHAHSG